MKVGSGRFILDPKIGAWASGGVMPLVMGINMIYYTDFHHGTLVLRPEIGVGGRYFTFVYGYNFSLTKNKLALLDYNVGSLFVGAKAYTKRRLKNTGRLKKYKMGYFLFGFTFCV